MRVDISSLARRRAEASSPQLRRLAHRDLPQLMALCARMAAAQGQPAPAVPSQSLLEAVFDAPVRTWVWVAERDGQLQGFIAASAGLAFPQGHDQLSVDALYVPPGPAAARLRQALQAHACAQALAMGCVALRQAGPELAQPGDAGAHPGVH